MRASLEVAPSLSIVIITRNEERRIGALLSALLSLPAPMPVEILVVDGASTDRTRLIVDYYERTTAIVRCLPLACFGFALQRNVGAAAAKGEFLLYLSADVEPTSQLLNKYRSAIQSGYDVAQGTAIDICREPGGAIQALCRFRAFVYRPCDSATDAEHSTINLLIRRSLVLAEPFDEALCALEDKEQFLRIRDRARHRKLTGAAVYHVFDETAAQFWKKAFREAMCVGQLASCMTPSSAFRQVNYFNWITLTLVLWTVALLGAAVAGYLLPGAGLVGGALAWILASWGLLLPFVLQRRWRNSRATLHWPWMALVYTSAISVGMTCGYLKGRA